MSSDLQSILPEVLLSLYALAGFVWTIYTTRDDATGLLTWATSGVFVLLAVWIGINGAGLTYAYSGMVVDDAFARFSKIVILVSGAIILLMSEDYLERRGLARVEYPILIAFSVVGMMVLVSASDLMALFVGLELMSLPLYVVISLRHENARSIEAGLKSFMLGLLSSAVLLYGISLIYGFGGTTLFSDILGLAQSGVSLGFLFGLGLVLAGVLFKLAAAPFHMWAVNAGEGAPAPITAFLATVPKMAAITLLARLVHEAFGTTISEWQSLLATLAVFSMFVGAVASVVERDLMRLMVFSSITHIGFALLGVAAGTVLGAQAVLFYITLHIGMMIGVFALILTLEKDRQPVTNIETLKQFAKREPLTGLILLCLLLSLAGIPPFVGFFGKVMVLQTAFDAGLATYAVLGIVAAAIAAFSYLRIVFFIYVSEKDGGAYSRATPVTWLTSAICAALVAAAWLPGINLFGLEPLVASVSASLFN